MNDKSVEVVMRLRRYFDTPQERPWEQKIPASIRGTLSCFEHCISGMYNIYVADQITPKVKFCT
jgi:hypothetical protein